MNIHDPIISEDDPRFIKKVVIGDCTLYHGDMLDIMPALEPVNCVVSDVPYLLTYGGPHGSLGGKLSIENYDNKGGIIDSVIKFCQFMPVICGAIKSGHVYIMVNNRNVQEMLVEAEKAGLKFHNLLVWDKISPTPNRWYMKNCEFIGFFYKGKAEFINDCGAKQLIRVPLPKDNAHPTVKPIILMQHYIENSTQEGQIVCDPFMGSGTTGIACVKSGRKFIGIEKDEKHFNTACERILRANDQGELFI